MDAVIETVVQARKIAVVGVSDRKMGGVIYKELKKRGYDVYPVHPGKESFDGARCYARLGDLPADVRTAVLAVSPEVALNVVDDACAAGLTHLWFQQGKDFSEAICRAESAGLATVARKCILMYAPPVTGIHNFHRFIANLFGRL